MVNTSSRKTSNKSQEIKQEKSTVKKSVPAAKKDEHSEIKITPESTEAKIKKVGEKLSEAADKGVETLKEVLGMVKDFSLDAAELTKLKVEIHRLKGENDHLLMEIGQKLWKLKDSEKFESLKSLFAEEFQKLAQLQEEIAKKEKAASKISL